MISKCTHHFIIHHACAPRRALARHLCRRCPPFDHRGSVHTSSPGAVRPHRVHNTAAHHLQPWRHPFIWRVYARAPPLGALRPHPGGNTATRHPRPWRRPFGWSGSIRTPLPGNGGGFITTTTHKIGADDCQHHKLTMYTPECGAVIQKLCVDKCSGTQYRMCHI